MSRLPIRVRLTALYALALLLVLAGAGAFVYVRLRADLDEAVDTTLRQRAAIVVAGGAPVIEDPEEAFVVLAPRPGLLSEDELRRTRGGEVFAERDVPGIEGRARMFARRGLDGRIVLAGQSLNDRDEALSSLVASLGVGGAIALGLASLIGYGLAGVGLAPVEAMRRRAREVSLERGGGERLPLPAARDEIRRLGETLNDMLERLQHSFERERRFVADASHELRTPLAVVKTELEAALRADDCGPQALEAIAAAVEECDRLAALAEDLLVLAQAAEGGLPIRREPIDPRALLEGVRDQFVDRAARHQRGISVELTAPQPFDADPLRLRQALGNLVDNALRHGAGDIVLAASGSALEVRDGGPGFPPDLAERAFERFARGDSARTRHVGSGLGLAIVRGIAEAHGGSASIAGAAVRIDLSGSSHPPALRSPP